MSTFAPPPQQQRNPIFALTAYAKNERADLSQADRNDFRHLTALLVEALREGNTTMSKVAESIRRGQCLSVAHDLSSVCSSWSVVFFCAQNKEGTVGTASIHEVYGGCDSQICWIGRQ